jgi:hypothetical protein
MPRRRRHLAARDRAAAPTTPLLAPSPQPSHPRSLRGRAGGPNTKCASRSPMSSRLYRGGDSRRPRRNAAPKRIARARTPVTQGASLNRSGSRCLPISVRPVRARAATAAVTKGSQIHTAARNTHSTSTEGRSSAGTPACDDARKLTGHDLRSQTQEGCPRPQGQPQPHLDALQAITTGSVERSFPRRQQAIATLSPPAGALIGELARFCGLRPPSGPAPPSWWTPR